MNIAVGIARGLHHLHADATMVHGNLTSNNILLDEDTNAKIADCGLPRLMSAAANNNVVATAGALGYRAPELSKLKKANTKTDIYSLGMIMLELLTGKSPGDTTNGLDLPQWVASVVEEEWTNEVFDLELMKDAAAGSETGEELVKTLKLALHCVDPSPVARPEAQQVLRALAAEQGRVGFSAIQHDDQIGKLALVGAGMRTNTGVSAKLFEALSAAGINIEMISTSEIRISLITRADTVNEAVRVVHTAFGLDGEDEAVVHGGTGR
jgi:serine/threonine protein kinase